MALGQSNSSATRHERLMEILADALELDPAQRKEFLDKACGGDLALRAEADRLLNRETAAAEAMNTRLAEEAVMRPLQPPKSVGACRIIRELGHGGMSVVYLASQQAPVRRLVAIKLLLPGMDTRQVIRRFESERQVLAVMSHPNVAQVYDAGTTDRGRPYFVMEYVDGVPITEYCDTHRLTTRQRLELFLPVCDAVQHAHQKAVIHRDLKPSNVLVMQRGDQAIPKVIDFGIAKAIDHTAAGKTAFTEHGQLVGTPEYMSPEQAAMGGVDIDTRTDVYSLGVLLYELLTGSLPFDRSTLRNAAYDEIRRLIREVDPPRPSTRLSTSIRDAPSLAASRQSDPRTLLRHVRGDLDWITMKALEKDRSRRYGSPAELAGDLLRHLRDQPVAARPPTSGYRIRKFARRHSAAVGVAVLVVLSLAGGVVATTWQATRARRAERLAVQQKLLAEQQKLLAEQRFNDVRKLAGTLIIDVDETIQKSGPTRARQQLVQTALEYLDKLSSESADISLLNELTRGYVHVGNVQYYPGFSHLGDPAGALASYQRAHALAQKWVAADPASTDALSQLAASYIMLGEAKVALNQLDDAIGSFSAARPIYEKLSQLDPQSWRWPRNIGLVLDKTANVYKRKGMGSESLAGFLDALSIYEQTAAKFPNELSCQRDVMSAHASLASLVVNMGVATDAIAHARSAAEISAKLSAADPTNLIWEHDARLERQRLCECLINAGFVAEPLRDLPALVAQRRKVSLEDPDNYYARRQVSNVLTILGDAQTLAGALQQAITSYSEALSIRQQLSAADPADQHVRRGVADENRSLAVALRQIGRGDEAIKHIDECLKLHEQRLAVEEAQVGIQFSISFALRVKGEIFLDQRRPAEALPLLQRAADIYSKPAPPTDRRELAFVLPALARAQMECEQLDLAARTAQEAEELADGVLRRSASDHLVKSYKVQAMIVAAALKHRQKDFAGAQLKLDEALRAAAELSAAEPASAVFAVTAAQTNETQADLYAAQGQSAAGESYALALSQWQQLHEMAPDLAVARQRIEALKNRKP